MRRCPQACRYEANNVLVRFGTKNGLDGEHGFGVETGQLRVDHAKVVPRLTGQMSSAAGASGRPIDHTGFVGQTLQDAGRGWPRGSGRTNSSQGP